VFEMSNKLNKFLLEKTKSISFIIILMTKLVKNFEKINSNFKSKLKNKNIFKKTINIFG